MPENAYETNETDTQANPQSWRSRLSRPSILAIVTASGLVFFCVTSPRQVPSVMLIIGFIVLGLMLYATLRLIMLLTGLRERLSKSNVRGIMLSGTVLPVLLLMLQSIGQLTLRDIFTLGGLFLIGVFYVGRVTASRT